jgi:hypothetical protein
VDVRLTDPVDGEPKKGAQTAKPGHLALYDYEQERDVVLVLAIRHQREAGYLLE